MQRWKNSLFNIAFTLNCLLLFLLLFENKLSIPLWLQVAGRMHPLILHFPLVLVVLYALTTLIAGFKKVNNDEPFKTIAGFLLLLAALTSVITALAGLFLSREEGYDAEALFWHKWSGAAISVFTLGWYYFSRQVQSKKIASVFTSAIALLLIAPACGLGSTSIEVADRVFEVLAETGNILKRG